MSKMQWRNNMSKIKMSDVFVRGASEIFTQLFNCKILDSADDGVMPFEYADIAINAYDDNQERIAELEAFLNKFVEASESETLITLEEAIELQRGNQNG